MTTPFLSADQQGIVVFRFWRSLAYSKRIMFGIGCVFIGFLVQCVFPETPLMGIPFLIVGNLLLIVRGYDNRLRLGYYSPDSTWEKADENKIFEVEQLIKKMRKWDRSLLDISNPLGIFSFIFVGILIFFVFNVIQVMTSPTVAKIFFLDAFILLLPQWFTGKRHIMTIPKLQQKIKWIKQIVRYRTIKPLLDNYQVDYFLLLKGKDQKIPDDIKFRVDFPEKGDNFLGLYGQIVTNNVGNKTYPYFYVVLVAKADYGLKSVFNRYSPSKNITKEYKKNQGVEVLVIRQTTTRRTGYHTDLSKMCRIFLEGFQVATTRVK